MGETRGREERKRGEGEGKVRGGGEREKEKGNTLRLETLNGLSLRKGLNTCLNASSRYTYDI